MSDRGRLLALAGVAAWVGAVGLAGGPLSAFCASPVAIALGWCAASVREGVTRDHPRRLVGAGLATAALGLLFACAGAGAAGLVTAAAGLAVVAEAARIALGFDAPSPGVTSLPSSRAAQIGAVALDEAVKLWWEAGRRVRRGNGPQRIAADLRAAAHRNHEEGWTDHPERSHLPPPPLEKAAVRVARVPGIGAVQHLTFASEFEPQDPEIREGYGALHANRTAHAYLWRHGAEPRPTLLCIHGYEMGRVALDARTWSVEWLHRELGFDVVLAVLPLHGERSESWRSGAGFLDGHPLWTTAAMSQAVWDLRRITGWLRADGASLLGVLGAGVGGCVAAVYASVEDGLASAVPVAPVAPLENFLWRQLAPGRRAELRAAGITEHLLARAWARHSPLRMRPRVSHEARLILGGVADRVVPPADVEALWEHWGRPAIHWSPGSHFGWLDRKAIRQRIASHLRAMRSRAEDG